MPRAKRVKRPVLWSHTAGVKPFTVRVHERRVGGPLYAVVWSPARRCQVRVPLKHRDRERAIAYAEEQARQMRAGRAALRATGGPATVARVVALYVEHRSPAKRAQYALSEDRRRAGLWTALYGDRRVDTLGRAEWDGFVRQRGAGAIDAHGARLRKGKEAPVGPRTVAADLKFARAVFNWSTTWNLPDGSALLERNPWAALPGVRSVLVLPKNRAPLRPVRTWDEYLVIRAAAARVLMQVHRGAPGARLETLGVRRHGPGKTMGALRRHFAPSYLVEILDLLAFTGRRVSAVLGLRGDDMVWGGKGPDRLVVAIRWRPVKHAEDVEEILVNEGAADAVARQLARVRAAGIVDSHAPLFPSFQRPDRPVTRNVAKEWLCEAEQLAEREDPSVRHLVGGTFHPYRRMFANDRKPFPDIDVARLGGWKDIATMKRSYQRADEATMRAAVEGPARTRLAQDEQRRGER